MKKALVFACFVVGFPLIARVNKIEAHQVLINGKPFANATVINGQLFVPLEDFAKAAGAKVTLEPFFKLQGSKLIAFVPIDSAAAKIKIKPGWSKVSGKDWGANQLFQVVKSGEISSNIVMQNGTAFIPLKDVAQAFGAKFNWTATSLKPNQSISLDSPTEPCPGCRVAAR